MSDKITSKNLSYDSRIPPFLRALHAQAAGNAADPDPILSKRRRAGKKRSESEEAEDAPLVVDDEGNVVDVRVDRDGGVEGDGYRAKRDGGGEEQGEEREEERLKDEKREAGRVAGIGASKKRKAGKVVGDAGEESKGEGRVKTQSDGKDDEELKKKAGKKKGKKIKLSFDEPE